MNKYIQQKQQQHLRLTVMLQSSMLTKPWQLACQTLFSTKNMLTNLKSVTVRRLGGLISREEASDILGALPRGFNTAADTVDQLPAYE